MKNNAEKGQKFDADLNVHEKIKVYQEMQKEVRDLKQALRQANRNLLDLKISFEFSTETITLIDSGILRFNW